jgi:hypothetical protein
MKPGIVPQSLCSVAISLTVLGCLGCDSTTTTAQTQTPTEYGGIAMHSKDTVTFTVQYKTQDRAAANMGAIGILDEKGKPVASCKLCDPQQERKFGSQCRDAKPKDGICRGVTGATVQKVTSLVILQTRRNPCTTICDPGTGECWDACSDPYKPPR